MMTKEERRVYNREWRSRNKDKIRESARRWRAKNPEKCREYSRQRRINNPEEECKRGRESYYRNKEKRLTNVKEYQKRNPEKKREWGRRYYHRNAPKIRDYNKQYANDLKVDVLTHYGGGELKCVQCGFSDIRALSIDHLEGNGTIHRHVLHRSIYKFLQQTAYPPGYQTLCMNCQWIKRDTRGEYRWRQRSGSG